MDGSAEFLELAKLLRDSVGDVHGTLMLAPDRAEQLGSLAGEAERIAGQLEDAARTASPTDTVERGGQALSRRSDAGRMEIERLVALRIRTVVSTLDATRRGKRAVAETLALLGSPIFARDRSSYWD